MNFSFLMLSYPHADFLLIVILLLIVSIALRRIKAKLDDCMNYSPFGFIKNGFNKGFHPLDEKIIHSFFMAKNGNNELPILSTWLKPEKCSSFKVFLIKEILFFRQVECIPVLLEFMEKEKDIGVLREIKVALVILKYQRAYDDVLTNITFDISA